MPSLPHLTENWAGVYFQVAITVLIFWVGVPSLVQAFVSEDIRRVVHRHRKWMIRGEVIFALSLFLALVTLSFIWILHPYKNDVSLKENVTHSMPSAKPLITIKEPVTDLMSAIFMTIVVFSLVQTWYFPASFRRNRVLLYLEKKCIRRIRQMLSPQEDALSDIQYLGLHGKAGIEKKQVLETLAHLTQQIQNDKHYSGAELEPIIQAIEITLKGGNLENFVHGARVLQIIITNLHKHRLTITPDMGTTLRGLQRIGIMAFELDSELATLSILEILTLIIHSNEETFNSTSQVLFELGEKALEMKRFLPAVAVLNRLETLATREHAVSPIRSVNYLGILAHFWFECKTAKERARLSLANITFQSSLRESIILAQKHHAALTHFETADKLETLLVEIEKDLSYNTNSNRSKRNQGRSQPRRKKVVAKREKEINLESKKK